MRRTQLFLIVLTISLSTLLILFAVNAYLAATNPAPYHSSWMDQMWTGMGGMMGGTYSGSPTVSSSYYWVIPLTLIGVVVVAATGLAFYMAFPEIRAAGIRQNTKRLESRSLATSESLTNPGKTPNPTASSYDAVAMTLTPEEHRVLEVLRNHEGRYLQKYIRKEAGLSRLKTHRIVARFAERGIVTATKSGNTNEIRLAKWLAST